MAKSRTALYPGTFDPITKGHMDIIWRGLKLVDRMVIGIAPSEAKSPLFSLEERIEMVRTETADIAARAGAEIEVRTLEGLLINFAREIKADVIIRGLRAVADFEYEYQMVGMNSRLNPDIETVFLMASDQCSFIASRLVKEVASFGGEIKDFVSPEVANAVRQKLGSHSK